MKRLLLAIVIGELSALVLLLCFTYTFPHPPVFTYNIADAKIGPAWYVKWRQACDEHNFLHGMIGNSSDPRMREFIQVRDKQIRTAYWLLYFESCLQNSSVFLASGVVVPLAILNLRRRQRHYSTVSQENCRDLRTLRQNASEQQTEK